MIWVDRDLQKLKERHLKLEWVDDMKTPSGRIHVGALRGVVIHDLMYKVLVENGVPAKFTYVFNDHDPMDAIPSYLDRSVWGKYAGMQLCSVPSPEPGFKSFAEFYAKEFQAVFESINCHPEIVWSSELYASGKMNDIVRVMLDNAAKIREIFARVSKAVKADTWYPLNVVCEKCKKVSTTQVYKWDGTHAYYRCLPHAVEWTDGCGHEGKIDPRNGRAKLPWRLDWPATWKVLGVTAEGAGKDHMSSGGSHDFASAICEEVLHYQTPYPLPYEWFTVGGRKMSSSKGVGISARDVASILPPDVFRFLIVRTPIGTALDFNPYGMTIPNLFDDYDKCMNAYFDKIERKTPDGKAGEVSSDFARMIELSQVNPLPRERMFFPRFRTVANLVKAKTNVAEHLAKTLHRDLTPDEQHILAERIRYANIYLETYAEKPKTDTKEDFAAFTGDQMQFLSMLAKELARLTAPSRDDIQNAVFAILKKQKGKPKDMFRAFYRTVTGTDFGPKAADLILEKGLDAVVDALQKASK